MFKNVSGILGQITPKQRIIALLMLLFTTVLVLTGPQLINSLRTVPTEYLELIDVQNEKIQSLSSQVIKLNEDVVAQSRQCTNRILERENEIAIMVGDLIRVEASSRQMQKTDDNSRMDTIIQLPNNTVITGLNAIYTDLTKNKN
jgi:hypothetical protein